MHTALWSLIGQTDAVTKLILCLLLGMSIACWAIFFYKIRTIRAKTKELKKALEFLSSTTSAEELLSRAALLGTSFAGIFIARYLAEYKLYAKYYAQDKETLNSALNILIDETLQEEEATVSVLSTSAAVSPLVGLFGTVWGLIHAFLGIGMRKGADIAAVAPGIAEALITTLAGLVIAIPALIMFSYIQSQFRIFEHVLLSVAEKCGIVMKTASREHDTMISIDKQQVNIKSASIT